MNAPAKQAADAAPEQFGKYYLLDQMAVGGMAEIYRGTQLRSGGFQRLVVIKRIRAHLSQNKDFVDMFNDEARITVTLQHPNIVQVFDFDQYGDHLYLAMEYVRGKDLRQMMRALARRRQFLPVEFAAYIALEIAKGLGHAHEQTDIDGRPLGIVHRDISPSNILLSYDGEVKVVDFGIARCEDKVSETRAGVLKGKFDYMSPEQIRGQQADARSDVFAVGILLHEMLSGRRLFKADSDLETLENIRSMAVPPLMELNGSVPQALNDIVLKALARDLDARYQSCRQMADDLREWMAPASSDMMRDAMKAFMHDLFAEDIGTEKAHLEAKTRHARELWQINASATPASSQSMPGVAPPPNATSASAPTLAPTGPAALEAAAPASTTFKVQMVPRAQSASRNVTFEDVPVVGYNPWKKWGPIAAVVAGVALVGVGIWKAVPSAPTQGAVNFEITPNNVEAQVWIDGSLAAVGTGNVIVQIPMETVHSFEVRAQGYESVKAAQLFVGEEDTLQKPKYNPVTLPRLATGPVAGGPGGVVQFDSDPQGAEVWLGATLLCSPTPCSWDKGTANQRNTVTFKKQNYVDTPGMMVVPASGGKPATTSVSMAMVSSDPLPVLIKVDNDGLQAAVKIDGKPAGTGTSVKLKLAPGKHVLEAELKERNLYERAEIMVEPGQADQTFSIRMYTDLNR